MYNILYNICNYSNNYATRKNWHDEHLEKLTFANKLADGVANSMGSWRFIIIQTVLVVIWMTLNVVGFINHWDAYSFILLNLLFSTMAAYSAPIIMMCQNRHNDRDRAQAQADYKTNREAKPEIEALAKQLNKLEVEKVDKLIAMLAKLKKNN